MSIQGQGNLFTLDKGHLHIKIKLFVVSEITFKTKFYVEPPLELGTNVNTNYSRHVIKMTAMPMTCFTAYGKMCLAMYSLEEA